MLSVMKICINFGVDNKVKISYDMNTKKDCIKLNFKKLVGEDIWKNMKNLN